MLAPLHSRASILADIRKAAVELGHPPSRNDLQRLTGISHFIVLKHFRSFREAVQAAGLEPNRKGQRISTADLLADYGRLARKLGHPPSRSQYVREGRYSAGAFYKRFGNWRAVEEKYYREQSRLGSSSRSPDVPMSRFPDLLIPAGTNHTTPEPTDKALAMQWAASVQALPAPLEGKRRVTEAICAMIVNTLMAPRSFPPSSPEQTETPRHTIPKVNVRPVGGSLDRSRPVLGAPFDLSALTNAPDNELCLVFLFGMFAAELGFQVESFRGRFPDCEAKRQVRPGKWQRQHIEFEFESRNFRLHRHDPARCDVIICWKHNWPSCPEHIEVIELSKIVAPRG
jgi:HNH endonuclease